MPDVLGYLQSKGLLLKRADARNVHTACFFCDEPSDARGRLYINTDPDADIPGLYLCHRCGAKGSIATLKRHFGDQVREDEVDSLVRSEILNRAAAYYQAQLGDYPEVLRYLKGPQRGLSMETIAKHQIGYAPMDQEQDLATGNITVNRPRSLYAFLRAEGYEPKDILGSGLCYKDSKRERVMDSLGGMVTIPYHVAGNVVAIRGRTWPFSEADFNEWEGTEYEPPKGKYKTCAGTEARLFNSDSMWGRDEVTLTEGELDALVLEQEGFAAVGVPGAQAWQDAWDEYIKPLKRAYLIFDRDSAGEKAATKLVDRFGSKVRRVHLSEEGTKCDPTEWIAQGHTAEDLRQLIDAANQGGLLVTVRQAITEFAAIQGQAGIKFGWELLDTMISPGLLSAQIMIPLAKTGSGKGHPLDTEVPTPNGLRRWGDLEVGDEVFGSDGSPTKVVGVYDRGTLQTYRVNFSDGASVEVDGDHVWTVEYRYGAHRQWVRKDLSTRELLESDLRHNREYRYRIPMCAPVRRAYSELPVEPYTLGALIANGYFGTSATLTTPDADVAARVAGSYQLTPRKLPEGACPAYIVRGVIGKIRALGLAVRSAEKFIPEVYLNAGIGHRVALLQGLLDGDGSSRAKWGRNNVLYFTSSRRLADDVVQLVTSLGGTAVQSWTQRPNGAPEGRLSIMLRDGFRAFSSARKSAENASGRYKTGPHRSIVSIEPAGNKEIRCISVDASDSLYLVTAQHVVTHNTLILLNIMHSVRQQPGQEEAKILFISLEQTRGEWWDRARRIHRFYDLESNDAEAEAWWQDCILLVDQNRVSDAEVRQILEDYDYRMGKMPDLVCVDYLGYWARSFKGEAYQRTSDAIMALKAIAKDYRVPIITPHQVSRGAHEGMEFQSDSARDSGAVEETADFVLAMWAPDNQMGRAEAERTGMLHARLAKSRHGGRGQLFSFQFAPLSLAIVPEGHVLAGRARKEVFWQNEYRDTWEAAVYRHITGFEGMLSRDQLGRLREDHR